MSRFASNGLPDPSSADLLENELKILLPYLLERNARHMLDVVSFTENRADIYSPHIIQPWFALAKSIYKLQTIQPQPRELAILAVTSVYHAPYVVYAHECLAAKVGISPEQVQMAVRGETPDGLNEVEAASYVLAKQLAHAQAPISDELWDAAYKVLGREGAVGVAHVVSGYLYVCTLEKIATPTVQSKDSAE